MRPRSRAHRRCEGAGRHCGILEMYGHRCFDSAVAESRRRLFCSRLFAMQVRCRDAAPASGPPYVPKACRSFLPKVPGGRTFARKFCMLQKISAVLQSKLSLDIAAPLFPQVFAAPLLQFRSQAMAAVPDGYLSMNFALCRIKCQSRPQAQQQNIKNDDCFENADFCQWQTQYRMRLPAVPCLKNFG